MLTFMHAIRVDPFVFFLTPRCLFKHYHVDIFPRTIIRQSVANICILYECHLFVTHTGLYFFVRFFMVMVFGVCVCVCLPCGDEANRKKHTQIYTRYHTLVYRN